MATDDDGDTRAMLVGLRALLAERAADEAAELAAGHESHAMQATRAIAILEDQRAWNVEDRRALGLPPSVCADGWLLAVRLRLAELEPFAVLDAWFDAVEAGDAYHTLPVAVEAFGRITTIAPCAERLYGILRDSSEASLRGVRKALAHSHMSIDADLLRLIRGLLVDPASSRETANTAIAIAGELACREPSAAAMIAERVRADRKQWPSEVWLPLSACRTVPHWDAAGAVERSGCASLAATALLELEERGTGDPRWASALVAVAGDEGRAHLARMRGRPGWSELSPPLAPPPDGLDALVSPIADVRRRALDAMAAAPRSEHLRALLLGAELDRHVVQDVLRRRWEQQEPTKWQAIFSAPDVAKHLDRGLVARGLRRLFDAFSLTRVARLLLGFIGAGTPAPIRVARLLVELIDAGTRAPTRAAPLLVELIDAGIPRAPMSIPQELTPALRELEAVGAAAFAAQHIPDPRLTADEIASLDATEAELARKMRERALAAAAAPARRG
jgi:hypothetical protein